MPRFLSWCFNALYAAAILAASPWLLYQALTKGKYRAGFAEKLLGRVPPTAPGERRRVVWLHAVSVGEVNLVAPLLAEIARRQLPWHCVLSTTTATGLALARKKYPELTTFYCPLDFTWAVNAAVARVRPDLLVLVELELWPNLIAAAHRRGAQVAVLNGRLSERSHRGYRRLRPLLRPVFASVARVLAQTYDYARRFVDLGQPPDRVTVTGSLKFDGVATDRANPATRELAALAGFQNAVVLLAGSTQDPEERLALDVFRRLAPDFPELRLVLVPRHPHRFDEVAELLDGEGVAWRRRSQLRPGDAAPAPVLLVDTVGELAAWWGTADVAFVGGSLGTRGGQNMIEPAAYGCAVSFGPNTSNFRDVVAMLLAADAAVVVADASSLYDFTRRCLADAAYRHELGCRARQVVLSSAGATARSLDALEQLLAAPPAAAPSTDATPSHADRHAA